MSKKTIIALWIIIVILAGIIAMKWKTWNQVNNKQTQEKQQVNMKKIKVNEENIWKKLNIKKIENNTVEMKNPKEELVNQIRNICSQAWYTKQGTQACKAILNKESIKKQLWTKIINGMKKEYNLNK